MGKFNSFYICATVFVALVTLPKGSVSQTYCSLKVQVPNLGFCDAGGLLEEDVQASVYETKGNINGIEEYQTDTFNLLDQQLTSIIENSDPAEGTIRGIQEEISDLANLLSNIQAAEALDESMLPDAHAREKRAASNSQVQLQQLLDAAKLTFQQAMADVTNRLQNITKVLQDKAKQTASVHAKLQGELATNKQSLTKADQELKVIDADIQKFITSGNTGPGGVNISGLSQDVTDLLINASVAEQIQQRQLDTEEKLIQKMVADEAQVQPEIQRVMASLSTVNSTLTKDENSLAITKGGERIFEDRVGQFLYNATNDVAAIRTKIASDQSDIAKNQAYRSGDLLEPTISIRAVFTQFAKMPKTVYMKESVKRRVGNQVVTVLTKVGQFSKDLKQARKSVDGVQSLVTFTNTAQQKQSGDILTMNKVVLDDIKFLKYAFGLLTSFP